MWLEALSTSTNVSILQIRWEAVDTVLMSGSCKFFLNTTQMCPREKRTATKCCYQQPVNSTISALFQYEILQRPKTEVYISDTFPLNSFLAANTSRMKNCEKNMQK